MAASDDLKTAVADVEKSEAAVLGLIQNLQTEITALQGSGGLSASDAAALATRLEAAIAPVNALVGVTAPPDPAA